MSTTTVDTRIAIDRPTVGALLRRCATTIPRRPLLVTATDRLDYGDAERHSARLAGLLIALGAGKGTRVALALHDDPQFVIGTLAAARIGAVVVPLPLTETGRDLRRFLVHSDARILLAPGSGVVDELRDAEIGPGGALWCPAVPQLRHVVDPGSEPFATAGIVDAVSAAAEDDVAGSDPLAVLYAADPDRPLGAVHTHDGLLGRHRVLGETRSSAGVGGRAPSTRIEMLTGLLGALATGTALRVEAGPGHSEDGMPAGIETGGPVFVPSPDGAAIRPIPGLDVRIVDVGTGRDAAHRRPGELCVRGPHVMLGYHGIAREDCFDIDGWFHTGSVARIGDDGNIHVESARRLPRAAPALGNPTESAQTMVRLVTARAHRHADTAAVIDRYGRLTYGQLDAATRELAAALVELGVGKGTRVGLLVPNGTEWARIAVALTRIGAVLVPLSTLLRPPELRGMLRIAAIEQLVAVDEFRGRRYIDDLALTPDTDTGVVHDPELPALRHIRRAGELVRHVPGRTAQAIADGLAATVGPADPLAIMFTSGSRGLPKGVLHSHGSAFGAVRSGLDARRIDSSTRLYLPMPLFWVGGFGGGLLSALLAGATLVTEDIPSPDSTLELLRREQVTLFRGWPDQAESLARHADSSGEPAVATLRAGSLDAMLPPELRARPGARANLFGMTESFGPYCGYRADTDMPSSAWGSCGRPFDGIEVRIVDPRDGTPCPAGTVGMILIRGRHVLRGLCRRTRQDVFTPDGFYVTGDLGHLDDDGFLFHHGRSDDMFKVSGATVYPSEVERALRGIDGVVGAFVTDVADSGGPRVAAAVVRATHSVTVEQLRSAAREVLSPFKVPTRWALLDSDDAVPRGPTGKVDISTLRTLFPPT